MNPELDPLGDYKTEEPKKNLPTVRTNESGLVNKILDEDSVIGAVVQQVVWPKIVDTLYAAGVAILDKICYGRISGKKRKDGSYIYIGGDGNRDYTQYSSDGRATSTIISGGGGLSSVKVKKKPNKFQMFIPKNGPDGARDGYEIAQAIEDQMEFYLRASGIISLQDVYEILNELELIDHKTPPATSNNRGWTDIKSLDIRPDVSNPNMLVLTLPEPLDLKKV